LIFKFKILYNKWKSKVRLHCYLPFSMQTNLFDGQQKWQEQGHGNQHHGDNGRRVGCRWCIATGRKKTIR